MNPASERPGRSPASVAIEVLVTIVAALALWLLVRTLVVKPYRIPSGSMEPTLNINQRILVDRIGLHFSTLHVGDIVVFHPPKDYSRCADPDQGESEAGDDAPQACDVAQRQASSTTFVKRLVGMPGDRLSIREGHVIRNGVAEKDGYILPCDDSGSCSFPSTITVPRGSYYMMGDNRPDSDDSRFWGPVPKAWVIGQAFLTYWPPNRIGSL